MCHTEVGGTARSLAFGRAARAGLRPRRAQLPLTEGSAKKFPRDERSRKSLLSIPLGSYRARSLIPVEMGAPCDVCHGRRLKRRKGLTVPAAERVAVLCRAVALCRIAWGVARPQFHEISSRAT